MAYYTTSALVQPASTAGAPPYAINNPVAGGFIGGSTVTAGTIWVYNSTNGFVTATGSSFITNGAALGMRVNDTVLVVDTANSLQSWTYVTAVTTQASGAQGGGGATLSAAGVAISTHA